MPADDRGLIRYWLEFEATEQNHDDEEIVLDGSLWRLAAVGVTAFDFEDALRLIRDHFEWEAELPPPTRVVEDVDVSTPPEWVRQIVKVPVWRGIWYPRYDV